MLSEVEAWMRIGTGEETLRSTLRAELHFSALIAPLREKASKVQLRTLAIVEGAQNDNKATPLGPEETH
jgi:hypothetical protein